MGPEGPCQTLESVDFSLRADGILKTCASRIDVGQGEAREWRGQAIARFLVSLEGVASPPFGMRPNGAGKGCKVC